MTQLKGFGVENFRVFKEHTWFDFAPITVLVGPNNSGKSSLIKALLLMKDNYDRNILLQWAINSLLKFDGGLHNMSSGSNIVNSASNKDTFTFEFNYENKLLREKLKFEFIYRIDYNRTVKYSYISLKTDKNILLLRLTTYDIYIDIPKIIECLVAENVLIDELNQAQVNIDNSSDFFEENLHKNYSNILERKLKNIRIIKKYFASYRSLDNSISFKVIYDKIKPIIEEFSIDEYGNQENNVRIMTYELFIEELLKKYLQAFSIAINYLGNNLSKKKDSDLEEKDSEALEALFEILSLYEGKDKTDLHKKFSQLEDIVYLPSIKGQPKRSYQSNEEHIINLLIKKVRESNLDNDVQEYLSKWQKKFNIDEIAVERDDRLDANYFTVGGRSLTDMGYGISQLVSLLIMISLQDKEKGNIFLLEEPESNMHPKYQSMLADIFVESKYRNQFIIETHSEYLIRKLQYLTAKGDIKTEDTVIYYFNDPNNIPVGERQVKKINILGDGSLSDDFGPGFYDEAAHWELELLKIKRNKSRQN